MEIYIHYEDLLKVLEGIGFLCGILYIILAAKENILCWVYGGISVIIYTYIFYISNLLAESALQVFYLMMSIYGFLTWQNKNTINIKSISYIKHFLIILVGLLSTIIISFILINFSHSYSPVIDSFTTSFAIITTFLAARKILENWIYWIIINTTSIYLYASKDLYITSALYIIYTILAVYGYLQWKKRLKKL